MRFIQTYNCTSEEAEIFKKQEEAEKKIRDNKIMKHKEIERKRQLTVCNTVKGKTNNEKFKWELIENGVLKIMNKRNEEVVGFLSTL